MNGAIEVNSANIDFPVINLYFFPNWTKER